MRFCVLPVKDSCLPLRPCPLMIIFLLPLAMSGADTILSISAVTVVKLRRQLDVIQLSGSLLSLGPAGSFLKKLAIDGAGFNLALDWFLEAGVLSSLLLDSWEQCCLFCGVEDDIPTTRPDCDGMVIVPKQSSRTGLIALGMIFFAVIGKPSLFSIGGDSGDITLSGTFSPPTPSSPGDTVGVGRVERMVMVQL